jgi:L-fuculose-phosphate aldolase
MAREDQVRGEIVEVGRRLYARGLISGNEGNVSVRQGDVLLVTPPGVCKGFLAPEMIVKTDLSGKPVDGQRASTEVLMHTAVYRRRPDAAAVVHAHPPVATGFAVAGIALDQPLIAEAVVTLGKVPVVPYGTPSTPELADNVGTAACSAQALLMANHGALTVGDSLYRAWERMEALEQVARIALVTRLLGVTNLLPAADVARLVEMRPRAGYPEPVCAPGGPPAPAPAPAAAPRTPAPGDSVVMTRAELVRLVTEAVERFRTH